MNAQTGGAGRARKFNHARMVGRHERTLATQMGQIMQFEVEGHQLEVVQQGHGLAQFLFKGAETQGGIVLSGQGHHAMKATPPRPLLSFSTRGLQAGELLHGAVPAGKGVAVLQTRQ